MKFNRINLVRIPLVAFALFLFVANTATAQRIAVVDVAKILESMPAYEASQQEIDQLASRWRQEIAQQYDAIKSMYNKYQAEQVLLSEEERTKREEEILAKERAVRDLQKSRFGPEGALFQQRQSLVKPLQDKVYKAIEDYANSKGYDLIIDKGGANSILFTKEAFDKTEDLIKEVNKN